MIHNGIRVGNVRRGDVGFSKGCPESWLTSPAYIYISMFNMSEMAFNPNCSMQEVLIDSTTGFFMTDFDDYHQAGSILQSTCSGCLCGWQSTHIPIARDRE
ncbi:hypothetical protein E4413_14650 [Leptospira interrogans]|nr:hypothetical protein C5473_16320 [Leptospira interrogans serovar Weerasinghe]KAA1290063.1 hypothetical protein C4X99_06210 [Leptospira interrogans serovar Geyaweera]QCO36493.1 hypothetical protein E4412_04090 [Leptospira interrogans]QCO42004.1 hypothetical protein E4413_14650 [Leptospira interrogans]